MEDGWTFLTNHGHVMLCIAADPQIRLKDVAAMVGITERATQRIVADLMDAGYLTAEKTGRRNCYQVNKSLHFRHPVERQHEIGELLRLFGAKKGFKRGAA
jgi:predicted transcriptional regulator